MTDMKDKSLSELLELVCPNARSFLLMRLLGTEATVALSLLGINSNCASSWRAGNANYRAVEEYVLSKPSHFKSEVKKLFIQLLGDKALIVLNHLISKGEAGFEKLERWEQRQVLQAISLLSKLGKEAKVKPVAEQESYEEILRRIRKGEENKK